MTQTCSITPLGPVVMSQVPLWNVCYAESKADGTFTSTVVTSQPYVTPAGVGLAFNSTGDPSVAFTGVGTVPATETCGANDLFLASAQGGTFFLPIQVSNGSASNGLVSGQAGNCTAGVCNTGDVTGWWPATPVSIRMTIRAIAFRDVHFRIHGR